jgi:hypothetical protein
VYRDVEKYRVGNRLVEPSGSRSDRPGLLAMVRVATKDTFDVIIVWREDRLYRGIRAMLTVLETAKDYEIELLLAKENFDPTIAPVRAWAAQMELDGMKERMPDEEFIPHIKTHYDSELGVQRRLTAIERAKDDFTNLDLEEQVKKYVVDLQSEMTEFIHANPQPPRRDIRYSCGRSTP